MYSTSNYCLRSEVLRRYLRYGGRVHEGWGRRTEQRVWLDADEVVMCTRVRIVYQGRTSADILCHLQKLLSRHLHDHGRLRELCLHGPASRRQGVVLVILGGPSWFL
jgi:hypothetical protein